MTPRQPSGCCHIYGFYSDLHIHITSTRKFDQVYKNKKNLRLRGSFYGFPIGTISKVKKIVLGLRYKGLAFLSLCQTFLYVIGHVFSAYMLSRSSFKNIQPYKSTCSVIVPDKTSAPIVLLKLVNNITLPIILLYYDILTVKDCV